MGFQIPDRVFQFSLLHCLTAHCTDQEGKNKVLNMFQFFVVFLQILLKHFLRGFSWFLSYWYQEALDWDHASQGLFLGSFFKWDKHVVNNFNKHKIKKN